MERNISDETITKLASWLTVITAIISLGNFLVSLKFGNVASGTELNVTRIEAVLPFRFLLFILLETALAYAFGRALIYFEGHGQGIPVMISILIALISAWTSLFNAQWLFLGSSPGVFGTFYTIQLGALGVVAMSIAIYFILVHFKRHTPAFTTVNNEPSSLSYQVLAFIVMFFLILYA
jgi:hypothetical protein